MQKKQSQPTIEQIAETSQHLYCWQETPQGRTRIWCKTCRSQGQEWATPEPCSHILNAEKGEQINMQDAIADLLTLMNEPADSQASADPN